MSDEERSDEGIDEGLRDRISQAGGQTILEIADQLLDNPVFSQAVSAAFAARDRALGAQHAAMGALDISSASDLQRLERRMRSLSDRLEDLEEQVDRVARDLSALKRQASQESPAAEAGSTKSPKTTS